MNLSPWVALFWGFVYKSPAMENREAHFQDIHIGTGRAFPALETDPQMRPNLVARRLFHQP